MVAGAALRWWREPYGSSREALLDGRGSCAERPAAGEVLADHSNDECNHGGVVDVTDEWDEIGDQIDRREKVDQRKCPRQNRSPRQFSFFHPLLLRDFCTCASLTRRETGPSGEARAAAQRQRHAQAHPSAPS